MPVRLNVGLSRKIGQPNYGSAGASCNLELELAASLLRDDPAGFQQQLHEAYAACRQAITEELSRDQPPSPPDPKPPGQVAEGQLAVAGGNGRNGRAHATRPATERQLGYLRQLAAQIDGLGIRRLEGLAAELFDKSLVTLTAAEASEMIHFLQGVRDGELLLDAPRQGDAA